LFFTSASFGQANAKRKVFKMVEIREDCPSQIEENGSFNCPQDSTQYFYNRNGSLKSVITSNSRKDYFYRKSGKIDSVKEFYSGNSYSIIKYVYDKKNNLTEKRETGRFENSVLVETKRYKDSVIVTDFTCVNGKKGKKKLEEVMNKNGALIRSTIFHNEVPQVMFVYRYDKKGNNIRQERYEWWNERKLCNIEDYELNKEGYPIKTTKYDCKDIRGTSTIDYVLNEYGEWTVKKITSYDQETITKRKFVYFD
jgi:hypothetical protein